MAVDLSDCRAKVWLLYLKHTLGERGRLSLNVLREVCSFLLINLLVYVTESYIRFFDFQTETWQQQIPLHCLINVNHGSRWILLEDGRVFCCGGKSHSGDDEACPYMETYILACDGAVERKADMKVGRLSQGLLALKAVYAFGGYGTFSADNKTCEKFQLSRNQWTHLPNMREARWGFNPCVFCNLIYLCGWGSETMEVFSPQTDTFLSVYIPVLQNHSCLYVNNDLLVLHQDSCIVKFVAGQGGQLEKRSQVNSPSAAKWQNSQPVVMRGHFFIVQGSQCVSFNMESGVQLSKR